uniref:Cilia- and flagella-associated protein 53 n=1 Tax=Cuerna arida TaxID=1464854 RepID=A0A1B6EZ23_9HEMI
MKINQREIIKSKFHIKTDKKGLEAKIRSRVNERLQAVEEVLERKRERLRELLLAEEREYIREYVTQAQKVSESLYDEQKQKALESRVKRQAEEAALAAEKRLQQYMNRCEELRIFREALNTKEVAKAVLKQIEDKKAQRKADIELEKMWHDVATKNYQLMVAYEEEEARKRKHTMDEINNILQNQIKGRELYKEEEKRLKMEERADLDKFKQKMIEEEESAKRERELKKQKMYEEMEEVKRQSAELHARRQAQEKVLDDMFCQLIQQELKREQDKIQDNKSQLRKESDFFRAYLQETAEKKRAAEAEADNLRALEVAKIEAAKHEQEVKKCEAVLKLKEAVLKERDSQIKARIKQKEDEKRQMEEEARLAELLRLENLQINMESKKALGKQQKEYLMDLGRQIEQNKQMLLKQCEDEERQLRESIAREEAYFNKVKDIMANKCSSETHPFMKKFQGLAI